MNRLTLVGFINQSRPKNNITIEAGDDIKGMAQIFSGLIHQAMAGYNSAPDVALNIMAITGGALAIKPAASISFQGAADVGQIMSGLALSEGLQFVNSGIMVSLSNPVFRGSTMDKIRSCARAADINFKVENNTLTIWPKTGAIKIAAEDIQEVSPATGLVGYPEFSSNGVILKTLFNPKIQLGEPINVKSSVFDRKCLVVGCSHSLASEVANGPWFTEVACTPFDWQ